MKRHASLHPLSQHHHFALIQALFIRRARQEPAAKRETALRRVAEKSLHFWEKKGKLHFREEEEVLLPAYARHVRLERDADVMCMLAEHALIRGKIGKLAELVAEKLPVEDELAELGRVLHDHVRLEEDVIFLRIEKTLDAGELTALGKHFTRLHRKGDTCDI